MNETNLTYQCPQCEQCFSVEEDTDRYIVACPGCGGELDLTELNPVEIATADSPSEASPRGIVDSDSTTGPGSVSPTGDSSALDASQNHDVVSEVAERMKNVTGKAIDAAARIARKENRDKAKTAVSDAMKSGKTFIQRLFDKTKSTNASVSYRWPEPGRSFPQFGLWRIPIIGYVLREFLNWIWCIFHPSWLKSYTNVDLSTPRHYVPGKPYGWFGLNRLVYSLTLKQCKLTRFDYSDGNVSIENAEGGILEFRLSELEDIEFKYDSKNWRRCAIIPSASGEFSVVELHSTLSHAEWDDIFGILHHAGKGQHSKVSFAKDIVGEAVDKILDTI